MGKAELTGTPAHITINGTLVSIPDGEDESLVILNGTVLQVRMHEPYRDSQLNELLYVIIVIVFYATALMTLIITQIKRQRREGTEIDYYDEYLQRNSEVKQTCQTATNIVRKSSNPPPALATAAFAAAAAGTLLGRMPVNFEDESSILLEDAGESASAASAIDSYVVQSSGRTSAPIVTYGPPAALPPCRGLYTTVKSPVLESIPDEEV